MSHNPLVTVRRDEEGQFVLGFNDSAKGLESRLDPVAIAELPDEQAVIASILAVGWKGQGQETVNISFPKSADVTPSKELGASRKRTPLIGKTLV